MSIPVEAIVSDIYEASRLRRTTICDVLLKPENDADVIAKNYEEATTLGDVGIVRWLRTWRVDGYPRILFEYETPYCTCNDEPVWDVGEWTIPADDGNWFYPDN